MARCFEKTTETIYANNTFRSLLCNWSSLTIAMQFVKYHECVYREMEALCMYRYVTCPCCGNRIFEAQKGSKFRFSCSKCHTYSKGSVDENGAIHVMEIENAAEEVYFSKARSKAH